MADIAHCGIQTYRVKASGRVIRLIYCIEGERYLCADDQDLSHPCYNLSDLEIVTPTMQEKLETYLQGGQDDRSS